MVMEKEGRTTHKDFRRQRPVVNCIVLYHQIFQDRMEIIFFGYRFMFDSNHKIMYIFFITHKYI